MKNVFNNTYGLARSVIAFGNLITFLFTDIDYYYEKILFKVGQTPNILIPNIFYMFGYEHILLVKIISILILIWVISGYLPQLSGILHAWIVFSFFTSSILIEGGDQIAQIITLLLIPVTLFDKRINHWSSKEYFSYKRPEAINYFCYSCLTIIRLQMAIVYFFAFVDKFKVTEWLDGSAFYYWYHNNPFGGSESIHFILDPLINHKFSILLITWGVLLLEILLFGTIFMDAKRRQKFFVLGVFFHFMIIIIHGLFSFFFAMLGGLIIYLLPFDKSINFTGLASLFTLKKNELTANAL